MNLLEIKNLKTSFFTSKGEVQAVRGVSFNLKKGEALGIVGESGSGKSVTSMSIMKLLPENGKIKEGEILFNNKDIVKMNMKEVREIRGKDIAMIFQDPMSSLNPLIPIGKQVGEMIAIHNKLPKDEIKRRAIEMLSKVKIPEPEKRYGFYPHQFSGGMRQRVMIAMALANNPEILIADEPTTALDVTIQDQVLKQMAESIRERDMSMIFITHDLAVVAQICTRVIVMYGGLIMESSPIEELFNNPSHPYTMGLFKSMPSMDQSKDEKLHPIAGSPPDMLNPPKGCPFAPRCKYARIICRDELPPMVEVSKDHYSLCHLQTEEGLRQEGNPFGEVKNA